MSENKKRRNVKKLILKEFSSVDRPEQEHALSVIMKRNDSLDTTEEKIMDKNKIIEKITSDENNGLIEKIIVSKTDTQKLTALANLMAAIGGSEKSMSQINKAADDDAENKDNSEDTNSEESTNEENGTEDLQEQLDDVNKKLEETTNLLKEAKETIAKSEALSTMNDVQKAHYDSLKDEEAETYLAKSFGDRQTELLEIDKANKVIYKSMDGTEYRKSDDERLIALAKRADEDHVALKKSIEEKELLELTKRAEDELKNLPGTVETHVALLKAIDSISDESVRDEAIKTLKAQNASMASAFKTVGSRVVSKGKEGGDPSGELEALAKAYSEKHNMEFYKAYDVISQKNPELVAQAVATN